MLYPVSITNPPFLYRYSAYQHFRLSPKLMSQTQEIGIIRFTKDGSQAQSTLGVHRPWNIGAILHLVEVAPQDRSVVHGLVEAASLILQCQYVTNRSNQSTSL